MATAQPPALIGELGAAQYLAVSTRTVRRLVDSGELPVVRLGTGRGAVRFDVADLNALIAARKRSAVKPAEASPPQTGSPARKRTSTPGPRQAVAAAVDRATPWTPPAGDAA